MTLSPAVREYLLAFADDEHMIGARHTNWIGLGPFLEEDLAFCSIAQDELGHAIGLYELLLDDDPDRSRDDLDAFAMLRDPGEYRSCGLAEIECSDWSDSLVRHWLYDRAEALRWNELLTCADSRVAAFAARALREESFHLTHAEQFMSRVATTDSSGKIVASIRKLAPTAHRIWDAVAAEADALAEGFVSASSAELGAMWLDLVRADLERWGLAAELITDPTDAAHSNRSERTAGFADFQRDLQRVLVLDPAATW